MTETATTMPSPLLLGNGDRIAVNPLDPSPIRG
jgi:hypothetical protein